jgi:hypothetical protein
MSPEPGLGPALPAKSEERALATEVERPTDRKRLRDALFEARSPAMTLTWYALPLSVTVAPAPRPAKHSNTPRRTATIAFKGQRPGFCR